MENPRKFEIGLVLAGTISAGAYSAGVIDFLLQALDAWDTEKTSSPGAVPDHQVKLRVVSGASGGAITAALLARALAGGCRPVTDPQQPPDGPVADPMQPQPVFANPLYATWVRSIDIKHLLDSKDLEPKAAPLRSLLDSTVLDYIGDNALAAPPTTGKLPAYVSDPLPLFFTTSNMRGVPYGLAFTGQIDAYEHMMTAYADYRQFALCGSAGGVVPADALALDARTVGPAGNWETMLRCALASGAFPIGLAPRLLSRPTADYLERGWQIPQAKPLRRSDDRDTKVPEGNHDAQLRILSESSDPSLVVVAEKTGRVAPLWPAGMDKSYDYWNVDGGLFNNQPLELARRVLTGGEGRNPRDGQEAVRALIMVEPFPTQSPVRPTYDDADMSLVSEVLAMFSALKEQARFKFEDLLLAQNENVYSRFVIAPFYVDESGTITKPAIAAEILSGFGAFFAEAFRHHDFQLGRRNCQQFLRRHFVLPEDNPLFALAPGRAVGWTSTFFVGGAQPETDARGKRFLPIIPLVGGAAKDVQLPRRPRPSDVDLTFLRVAITARLEGAVPRLIEQVPIWIGRAGLTALWKGAWLFGQRHKLTDMVMEKIESELNRLR